MTTFGKFWLTYALLVFVGCSLTFSAEAQSGPDMLFGLMCHDSDSMITVMETYRDFGYEKEDEVASKFVAEGKCVRIPELQPIGLYTVMESVVVGKRRLYGLARDPHSPPVFWAQSAYTDTSI